MVTEAQLARKTRKNSVYRMRFCVYSFLLDFWGSNGLAYSVFQYLNVFPICLQWQNKNKQQRTLLGKYLR